ncbi:MAG: 2-oxo acid dehydrogenase subunit E2, partial [Marmoricola sp.]
MPESTENPLAAFGANEWLVDEMYEQYQKDPSSVDPAWWDFFASYKGGNGTAPAPASNGAAPAAAPAAAAPAPAAPAPAPTTPAPAPVATPSPAPTPAAVTAPPAKASTPASAPVPKEAAKPAAAEATDEPTYTVLRGIGAATAKNMDVSLSVPTATSVRNIPVKLLWDNRIVINNHLKRARGGKVSFTHLIGYAIVKAIKSQPAMNNTFAEIDGKPTMVTPAHINLGLAIDQQKADGTRQLVAPSIKACEGMDFAQFWTAYEEIVRKAKDNKLTMEDYTGTTVSLTNVGGLGTNNSVPRLMQGQAAIIGVGSMDYPPEAQGASEETITRNAISRIMTMTSTYDHRVIQGAQSGEFLGRVHKLLLGEDGFYDEIFRSLRIPYEPIRWAVDISHSHDSDVSKQARILELIHAYRVRGHMMADTD